MAHETRADDVQNLRERIAFLERRNQLLEEKIVGKQKHEIIDSINDAIVFFNDNGQILDVNAAFCSHVGKDKQEIISMKLEEFIPLDKRYKLKRQQILLSEAKKAKGILPILTERRLTYFDIITTKDENTKLNISVMRDITNKRIMEEKVKNKDDLVRALFLQTNDGIIFWDLKGKIVNANSAACRIFESEHHQLVGKRFKDFVVKKDEIYHRIMSEIHETGASTGEFYFTLENGVGKFIEFTSRLHSIDGYHITIFRDVSNRHQMEEELRYSELKSRKVFEGTLDGLILWDQDMKIIDVNPAAETGFGVSKSKIVGQYLHELVTRCPNQQNILKTHIEDVIRVGQMDSSISLENRDGDLKHYEFSSKNNVMAGIGLSVFRDVTEKKEMQEQLRKSDTLSVIGELAAGIAHEIRNPMTALKGFIQLLQDSIKEENAMYYEVITSELQRIDMIINEFLILAKPQAIRFQEHDVTKIMKETVDLLGAQAILHNIQLKTSYEKDIEPIFCEPNQLKKVFINVIKNAIEVMHDGGNIEISLQKSSGSMLLISIKDEGTGIPLDKLKRLGEPFYTTKDRGTGLGLMVSYRIIEEHKGTIKVKSEEGKGSTFEILLPFTSADR